MYFSVNSGGDTDDPEDIALRIVTQVIRLPEDNPLDHIPVHVTISLRRETGNIGVASNNGKYAADILLPAVNNSDVPYTREQFPLIEAKEIRVMVAELEQLALQNDVGVVTVTDVGGRPMVYHYNVTWAEALFMIDNAFELIDSEVNGDEDEEDCTTDN